MSTADGDFADGGFNVMRQMEPYGDRHRPLPFERRLDDQYERVQRARQRQESPRL